MGSRGWVNDALWMTVNEAGVPRHYGTAWEAFKDAREQKLVLYRQDRYGQRVDIVYDPAKNLEHKPGEFTVLDWKRENPT